MFNFNLKKAAIYQAVKWEKHPAFRFAQPLKKLFLVLFIFCFLIFIYGFLADLFTFKTQKFFLGLLIIFFVLIIVQWLKITFLNSKLKKPKLKTEIVQVLTNPDKYNLAEFLSFEVAKAVWSSLKFSISRNIPEINSTILFYFLLTENFKKLNFIFLRLILDLNEIKQILKNYLLEIKPQITAERRKIFSQDFQAVIFEAFKTAQQRRKERVDIGDILIALSKENQFFKKICEKIHSHTFNGLSEKFYRWLQLKIMPKHLKELANQSTSVIITDQILKFHDKDKREDYREKFKSKIEKL